MPALELGVRHVIATDLSFEAINVARCNAARLGASVEFFQTDLLKPFADGVADIVVSNPPYVPLSDRASLQREVREWEPSLALFRRLAEPTCARLIPEANNGYSNQWPPGARTGIWQSEAVSEFNGGVGQPPLLPRPRRNRACSLRESRDPHRFPRRHGCLLRIRGRTVRPHP